MKLKRKLWGLKHDYENSHIIDLDFLAHELANKLDTDELVEFAMLLSFNCNCDYPDFYKKLKKRINQQQKSPNSITLPDGQKSLGRMLNKH